jgi:hypothetical protein
MFRLWHKAVRESKTARCMRALQKNLFKLDPTFQQALLQFNDLCLTVERKQLVLKEITVAQELPVYLATQQAHLAICQEELSEVAKAALACITTACKASLWQLERDLADVRLNHLGSVFGQRLAR